MKDGITKENVHLFSKHYKEADRKTQAIAKIFLKKGVIDYDKEEKVYLIDYSYAHYKIKWDKKFVCSCGVDSCPHVLALYLMLKIWNSERRSQETEKNISADILD